MERAASYRSLRFLSLLIPPGMDPLSWLFLSNLRSMAPLADQIMRDRRLWAGEAFYSQLIQIDHFGDPFWQRSTQLVGTQVPLFKGPMSVSKKRKEPLFESYKICRLKSLLIPSGMGPLNWLERKDLFSLNKLEPQPKLPPSIGMARKQLR